jgi:hypothetical protein
VNDSRFVREEHTHNIETKPIQRNVGLASIPGCRSDQVGSFRSVDGFLGKPKIGRRAALDFHDDQTCAIPGYQVQLA